MSFVQFHKKYIVIREHPWDIWSFETNPKAAVEIKWSTWQWYASIYENVYGMSYFPRFSFLSFLC